ncbi:hypothetical protein [Pseudomonas frederiksbergensis]|uniref:Uncharacterized protein n=1 Tax=Pseudomonas frederiksbergensis TaxID=104087 RepID=A0A6L5C165_9PSED|nr:hypothetical protein [Pseudomonas frederiksbergensis]KAF2394746.1 hypothetical protein FX983_02728 [Pseudomonas frederiksbergensis]
MFNKDFLAHNQTAIELKIRKNSGHRLRHLEYVRALISQGFFVSGVWELALILEGVTKLFGNRYKPFCFCPPLWRSAERFTPPYVSPYFRSYADLQN